MFRREKSEQNGEPHCGQVRVLVVGDSGVGKTSLAHLIMHGSSINRPPQTVGCSVSLKHITCGSSSSSSNSSKGGADRGFFVELWDISGHDRYKNFRSLFYSQINGVIFVYDPSQRRTKTSLIKWASEIAETGTFSDPMRSAGPGGLPVPYIVIKNKADIASKEGKSVRSGNLIDVALRWAEKRGLRSLSEELPLVEGFPGSGAIVAAAKEARFDKEAITRFFRLLIRRQYFPEELPSSTPSPWSTYPSQRPVEHLDGISSEEARIYNNAGTSGDPYEYNVVHHLPAQHSIAPPTLFSQRPISANDLSRFGVLGASEISYTRTKRTDIV